MLIVEDENSLRESLVEGLSQALGDMIVVGAASAEEAEALLPDEPPRLIISDIRLPGMDGVELLLNVRNRWSTVPFIFMSAYPSPEAKEQARELGIQFLCKPFDFDEMLLAVEGGLDQNQFSGELGGISVVDLLQILNMGRRTAAVTLKRRNEIGRIFLSDGEIVHAEVADLSGRAAFDRLMAWKGGTFGSEPDSRSSETTIDDPFNALLLDCFRVQDEKNGAQNVDDLVEDLFASETAIEPSLTATDDSINKLIGEGLELIPECVSIGCVDIETGELLGLAPASAIPESVAEAIPAAVRAVFEQSALRELDSALARAEMAARPGAEESTIREVIALSGELAHHFQLEMTNQAHVFVSVSRSPKNLGSLVSKSRSWLSTFSSVGVRV